jgi:hypothetical protein
MTLLDERQALERVFQERASAIAGWSSDVVDHALRDPDPGGQILSDAQPSVDRARAMTTSITKAPLYGVDSRSLQEAADAFKAFIEVFDGAVTFSKGRRNSPEERASVAAQLSHTSDNVVRSLLPLAAYIAATDRGAVQAAEEGRAIFAHFMGEIRSKTGEIEAIKKEAEGLKQYAEDAVTATQRAAGQLGASKHAIEFGTLATEHRQFGNGCDWPLRSVET